MWDAGSVYDPLEITIFACLYIWQHLPGKNRVFVSTQISGSQTHVFGVSTWVSSGIFLFGQSFGIKHLGKLGVGEACRAPRNSALSGFWPLKRKTSEWKRESWVYSLALLSGHVGSYRHWFRGPSPSVASPLPPVLGKGKGKSWTLISHSFLALPCYGPQLTTWGCVCPRNVINSFITKSTVPRPVEDRKMRHSFCP